MCNMFYGVIQNFLIGSVLNAYSCTFLSIKYSFYDIAQIPILLIYSDILNLQIIMIQNNRDQGRTQKIISGGGGS